MSYTVLACLLVSACSSTEPDGRDLSSDEVRQNESSDIEAVSEAAAARSPVVAWNRELLQAIKRQPTPPTVVARSLSLLHEAMLLTMVATTKTLPSFRMDPAVVAASQLPLPPGPPDTVTRVAVESASYVVLRALFPLPATAQPLEAFAAQRNILAPTGELEKRAAEIGKTVAQQVLARRSSDGSNALGDLKQPNYSDYTNYTPVNTLDKVNDVEHWQPQGAPGLPPFFVTAHWGNVKTRVLETADQFRPEPPPSIKSDEMDEDIDEVIDLSEHLSDEQKMKSEYWENNFRAPWIQFAHWISYTKNFTMEQDIKMFYALSETLHDTIIAVFEAKRHYDYVRPFTAIRELRAEQVLATTDGEGDSEVLGKNWTPFIPTPPAPEYPSGHSAVGHASAVVLAQFAGDDRFDSSVLIPARSSKLDPTLPDSDLRIEWSSFSKTAQQSADSRRHGGIHFKHGDQAGRKLGTDVANFAMKTLLQRLDWK